MTQISGFDWFVIAFKKYFVFNGRATRSEFWYFTLFQLLINILIGLLGIIIHLHNLQTLSELIFFIPNISVGVRRLHDTNRSGWWYLFFIVNIIFFCQKGNDFDNRFGGPTTATKNNDSNLDDSSK